MSKVKKAVAKKKGANGYKLPEPIPKGEILTDVQKQKWQIGPSIGVGGFGEIYSASVAGEAAKSSFPYVIKIEPHLNGPLFVEMHFYMKCGKQEDIAEWMKQKKLLHVGMPRYIGSGSHVCHGEKYRFVVMDRYSRDIWSLFLENNRKFPVATVLRLAYQLMNVLEYIHHKGYVHADVKGANILLGLKSTSQVYLVDFGLASKCVAECKPNPKKAHNGTAAYTSRDAHIGALTMRGDLEIVAYNLLEWLSSTLPWEDSLTDVNKLHQQKTAFMSNTRVSVNKCFGQASAPDFLLKYFDYISQMSMNQVPDYDFCRSLFKDGLKKCGSSLEGKLEFSSVKPGKGKPSKDSQSEDDILEATPSPKKRRMRAAKPVLLLSSDDEENCQPKPSWRDYPGASVPTERKRAATKKKDDAPSWRDHPAAAASNPEASVPTERKKAATKKKDDAPSWRDHPAAAASNLGRPGEYIPTNGTSKTRKRLKD